MAPAVPVALVGLVAPLALFVPVVLVVMDEHRRP